MNRKKILNSINSFRFKRFTRTSYAVFNSLKKVISIGIVAGSVLSAMIVSPVKGQTQVAVESRENELEHELAEVTVSASRLDASAYRMIAPVTVITSEQIRTAPVQSIQDLLVNVANVDIVQRGPHGVQADISIRGGSFDQNAVLLNGINLANAHTGHYAMDVPVNLSDIERIEIVHGPAALAYGAGAFSGGINIITKKNKERTLHAGMEAGMYKLKGVAMRLAGSIGATTHSISASNKSSAGYMKNSDYSIYNALWQSRFQSEAAKIDLQLGYNDKSYGASTFYSARFPNQYEQTGTRLGSIRAELGKGKFRLIPAILWNRHYDRFELTKGSESGRNFHCNDTYSALLSGVIRSNLGTTSLGGELKREEILSSVLGKPMKMPKDNYRMADERTNSSAFIEHSIILRKVSVSAGIMLYSTTLTGAKPGWFPSVAASWKPTASWQASVLWRKSTRMPTFTDLYYTTETHDGNAGLLPEKSESIEAGLRYRGKVISASLTGFVLHGKDLIDWIKYTPNDTRWASWNHTQVNTRGIEADINLRINRFTTASLGYTRMIQKADTRGMISAYTLNYLRDKLTARLSHPLGKLMNVSWYFRYQNRMGTYEKFENQVKVGDEPFPAFSTLDLSLNKRIDDVGIFLHINNLFNRYYFDKGNLPQPGFWLMGGVSIEINQ
ncbi:MAG: TonB-dependent receptor [Tannerellaceae bacterium]|jgi:iron complex outermembrane receptor protein|nr:TonB-dependent receptor [Tannerellaceae bacterium]